ncbi:outer membrane efflux protein [Lysobacter helvus]|uniref:Outer membrane efflux protein n=2 Tax=Lysobacteraceae TaxID=32033 RepID=A0ABM7Q8Y4_9GAMM|nr:MULTISPECIES: TolC family protein [Lysobacter]BCT93882.1 outer membrane efflux protein [Lysobacter caseinilyticus]BCT97038.1 outer membrane efflux protein [Lysobacter helvus]
MNARFDRCSAWRLPTHALAHFFSVVMLTTPFATAVAADDISLSEALRLAGTRAPMLDARRFGVAAAQEEAARAGALPDPRLTIGVDNYPVTGSDAFDASADDMTMKKIGLWQEIPSRAKRLARVSFADRQVDEATAKAEAEALAVRRATAEAWIAVWSAHRELTALQMLREQAALAAKLAKARVSGGSETVSDALATEAALLELDNRIEATQAEKRAAQAGLARWVGDAAVEVSNVAPDFNSLPMSESQLLAAVDRVGPLLPATAQVETAAAAIDVARADKRSDWSVGASYGQRAGGRSDMIMLEVGIGLPLFSRNRQDRGISAREADYQAALASREDLRRQEAARIRADIARWEGLKRQVVLHEDALLPLAQDRSATTLAAYRAGGDLQPWLSARRDELDVHLAHAEHLGELGRAWAALAFLLPAETQP